MARPLSRLPFAVLIISAVLLTGTGTTLARDLTLAERVQAQEAIERVYYSHTIEAKRPFDEAVPRAILEQKVTRYLKESVALDKVWDSPLSGQALARELTRIANRTRMPDRLRELFAALNDDPFLIQECLVRPILVARLSRAHFSDRGASWDAWWREHESDFDETSVSSVASAAVHLPVTAGTSAAAASVPANACVGDDVWLNGILDDAPDPRNAMTSVWTGSEWLIWGGYALAYLNTGARYNPATDTWSTTSLAGAPTARSGHSAVWTGSEMIVWGGSSTNNPTLASGGRYDPLTDTWKSMSAVGAPSARYSHAAVWTGSVLFVWGGWDGSMLTATGGRYDPGTDSWSGVSTSGAPAGFFGASAIWTGTYVVVWGGLVITGNPPTPYGGRYDPVNDVWYPVSTLNEPTHRENSTTVWTGSRMIVWGGLGPGSPPYLNDGGRYDPVNDTWLPMPTTGIVPSPREMHSAVWTGSRMVIWGGYDGNYLNSGASYDPVFNRWTGIVDTAAPAPRGGHAAAWTGSLMLVWGGYGPTGYVNTGGRFDPSSATWTPTFDGNAPSGSDNRTAVWTGTEMITWGLSNTGGRYDPALDNWSSVSTLNAPAGFSDHTAVWTGDTMVVWGGIACPSGCTNLVALNTGGRYHPLTDSWEPTSTTGAPAARYHHTAVWTGSEMIVWGGINASSTVVYNTGGRYDPIHDTWTPTSVFFAGLTNHTAVWTGSLMIVWVQGIGYRYNPSLDAWSSVAAVPSFFGLATQSGYSAIWTGSRMIIWGGPVATPPPGGTVYVNKGAQYDPVSNSWSATSTVNAPAGRARHTAVWTGSHMIVWGGQTQAGTALADGGRYDPIRNTWTATSSLNAPGPRFSHESVWDGQGMLVFGGIVAGGFTWNKGGRYISSLDADHDGFTICAGDCNDANPAAHPGATEVCNGIDDDCDLVVDNAPDADGDGAGLCSDCDDTNSGVLSIPAEVAGVLTDGASPTTFTWDGLTGQAGPDLSYDVISGHFSFTGGFDASAADCLGTTAAATPSFTDSRPDPTLNNGYWYLMRGRNSCGAGIFGIRGEAMLVVGPCP